ncbi:MAG: hypothetical protein R2781_11080 [Flavobacteriaceae bacterium]
MRSEYTEENEAIPPDFGKNKEEVLLLQMVGLGRDNFMKKAARKNYEGPYEVVKPNVDIDEAYPDKVKYRWIFDHDLGTSYSTKGIHNSAIHSNNYKRYYVYDRLNDKKYSSGAEFTYYAQGLKIYMEVLNNKRNGI